MATENYGIYGELIQSLAATPVSTDTKIIFIGACASGDLNRAYEIASFADYATRLGGAVGDGYNLTEAAIAAFQMVGLGGVVMIPVSHSTAFSSSDYVGDGVSTGAAAIVRHLASNPTAVVLVCAPSITDATALSAVKAACKKADGHWDSVLVYDTDIPSGAVDANDVFIDADAVTKAISDEQAICCLGKCKTDGAAVISMAAVRCCLMARADAGYGVPARSGGNLAIRGMSAWGMIGDAAEESDTISGCTLGDFGVVLDGNGDPVTAHWDDPSASMASVENPSVTFTKESYLIPNTTSIMSGGNVEVTLTGMSGKSGSVRASFHYTVSGGTPVDVAEATYSFSNGKFTIQAPSSVTGADFGSTRADVYDSAQAWHASAAVSTTPFSVTVSYPVQGFIPVDIPEARSTELSANGVCAIVNYSGTFYTWGDHTSAFSAGTVSDERARFDNTIRMQIMITNRFQMKYRTSVDAPMTLQMRDDVINEELDFLASLVAIGALIGEPVCEFSPLDNSTDGVAQGQFVWRIADTPTIPFKYGNLKVAYTQAGLSVYMQ